MKKSKKIAVIIFAALMIGIVGGILISMFTNPVNTNGYFMYATIDECDNLISDEDVDAEVVRYNDPSGDDDFRNLLYERFLE